MPPRAMWDGGFKSNKKAQAINIHIIKIEL